MDGPQQQPADDEVKWQVALFALMPLILGNMTQQVGSVLGTPPEYGIWLRSSPVFCVLDMGSFLCRIVVRWKDERGSLRDAYRAEVAARFGYNTATDEDGLVEDSGNGVGGDPNTLFAPGNRLSEQISMENSALVRWLMIVLGGIPCQTIKLVAMSNIPFTRTLAAIYFISLIFGEVIALTGPIQQRHVTYNTTFLLSFADLVHYYLLFSSACHLTVTLWLRFAAKSDILAFLYLFQAVVFLASVAGHQYDPLWASYGPHAGRLWGLSAGMATGILFNMRQLASYGLLTLPFYPVCLYFSSLAAWLLMDVAIRLVGNSELQQRIGLPVIRGSQGRMAEFFGGLLVLILGYAYLFDGRGTVNPSWTGVFG